MNIVLNSFLLVFASEMGDKTQLLALVLASRFKRPWTVMGGILAATLLNHALASCAGEWISSFVSPHMLKWILAAIFFIFAAWILIPDKDEEFKQPGHFGAFFTTAIVFFLAEMGDKTQLATLALGARYANVYLVTLGTTAGMLAADGLAVFCGKELTRKISMQWIRRIASAIFVLFGLGVLLSNY